MQTAPPRRWLCRGWVSNKLTQIVIPNNFACRISKSIDNVSCNKSSLLLIIKHFELFERGNYETIRLITRIDRKCSSFILTKCSKRITFNIKLCSSRIRIMVKCSILFATFINWTVRGIHNPPELETFHENQSSKVILLCRCPQCHMISNHKLQRMNTTHVILNHLERKKHCGSPKLYWSSTPKYLNW